MRAKEISARTQIRPNTFDSGRMKFENIIYPYLYADIVLRAGQKPLGIFWGGKKLSPLLCTFHRTRVTSVSL